MPQRSPQHHEERRDHILAAALRVFSRDGFQAASMADIIAEAQVSAGSIYRYFPSKADLAAAAGKSVFLPASAPLRQIIESGEVVRPTEAMGRLFAGLIERATAGDTDYTALTVDAWAYAQRDEGLRTELAEVYNGIRNNLHILVTRWRDAGHLPADADTWGLTIALAAVMPGLLLQRQMLGTVDAPAALTAFAVHAGI
ncbi:TetR/AcrR family transcriptional regulator [Demequina sp. B12]|uniref:TetR/AcrR family transcriptional regulator n=1 Tax=Demequina sp. B12 TaxID=2992757 RepID=UPI00237A5BD0|nr:TetR/AcrR family transcriptional regulator [Demequina sp. B12]MDE0571855.1 TetR/AcrR family transcriptional regulator [Demequina sp. B12]